MRAGENLNERATRWVGTINNPEENWIDEFKNENFQELVKYMVCGSEHAPTTGTLHVHFYIHFKQKIYRSTIRRFLPRCWMEPAKGSELKNIQYVTKTTKQFEFGEPVYAAQCELEREDKLKEMLKDVVDLSWNEFENKYPIQAFYQKQKLLDYKISHMPPLQIWDGELQRKNFWIWGEPGCGKSYWARTRADPSKIYPKNTNKWWNGYDEDNHKIVIIEDFPADGGYFAQLMKVWSDRYTFIGETKGGQVQINPGKFFLIITSNYAMEQVFAGPDNEAIRRRFTEWNITGRDDLRLQSQLDFEILQ